MFGIDIETFHALWPSLIIIVMMIGAMIWGALKVTYLISNQHDSVTHRTTKHAH